MRYGNDTFESVRDSISWRYDQSGRIERKIKRERAATDATPDSPSATAYYYVIIVLYMFYGACTRRHQKHKYSSNTQISKSLWQWWRLMCVSHAKHASHYALITDYEVTPFQSLIWDTANWYININLIAEISIGFHMRHCDTTTSVSMGLWRKCVFCSRCNERRRPPTLVEHSDHFQIPEWLMLFPIPHSIRFGAHQEPFHQGNISHFHAPHHTRASAIRVSKKT